MPSYKLLPTENERYDPDLIREGVHEEAGSKSSLNPRRGMMSDSFEGEAEGDILWVNYGWESMDTRRTWDGEEQFSYVEIFPIFFLQNGYIAQHKGRNEVTSEIRATLQRILQSGIALDHIEFEPNDLLTVLDQADSVQRLEVAPSGRNEPDYLSASDRDDLRKTDFVDDYEGEPFEKVKISVPGEDIDVNVGFDRSGTVILYGRNMKPSKQATALRFLCDNIIDNYVNFSSHQGNFSRF